MCHLDKRYKQKGMKGGPVRIVENGHEPNPVWQFESVDIEHEPGSEQIPDKEFSVCGWGK
jgi:hypothetical protein